VVQETMFVGSASHLQNRGQWQETAKTKAFWALRSSCALRKENTCCDFALQRGCRATSEDAEAKGGDCMMRRKLPTMGLSGCVLPADHGNRNGGGPHIPRSPVRAKCSATPSAKQPPEVRLWQALISLRIRVTSITLCPLPVAISVAAGQSQRREALIAERFDAVSRTRLVAE
jgi:hypothetical protein